MPSRASSDKKERERLFFEQAQTLLPELWPNGRTDTAGENPDIVVQTRCGGYGVEVTELLNESVMTYAQRLRRVCSLAQERLLDSTLKEGLSVMVAFKEGVDLAGKPSRNRAVAELVDIVRRSVPPIPTDVWKQRVDCRDNPESDFFSAVWLHYHPAVPRSIWQPVTAWWVPTLKPEAIAHRISEKERRIPEYQLRAENVFLLLVVYGFDGASATQVSEDALSARYQTAFAGVVLLDCVLNRVHCLRTEKSIVRAES